MKFFFSIFMSFLFPLSAVTGENLRSVEYCSHPFNYPLNIKVLIGREDDTDVVLCCHGYGGNNSIAEIIRSHQATTSHLVSFNFPDFDFYSRINNCFQSTFGTIKELLPALYVLKTIVDSGAEAVSLYGFSCGGGAVVNLIGVLNTPDYDSQLQRIGIQKEDKERLLRALEKGVILLDCPLKSMEEINDEVENCRENRFYSRRYAQNGLTPLVALNKWQGVNMKVVLFFQKPDASVGNRDDLVFYNRLKDKNMGYTFMINVDEGGHLGFHHSLWQAYEGIKKESKKSKTVMMEE